MVLKHFSVFRNTSTDLINWNQLRDSQDEFDYFIPENKIDYINLVQKLDYNYYRATIIKYCAESDIKKIISIGSGRCGLEWHLKTSSNLNIIVTDITDSIQRIKGFGIFDDAFKLDVLKDSIDFEESTLVLLFRIDTEFDEINFSRLFEVLSAKGAKRIIVVPAQLLNGRSVFAEFKIWLKSILLDKKRVFCGYSRSKSEFKKAWMTYFEEDKIESSKNIFKLIKK